MEKVCINCGHHITSHYGGEDMSCKHQDCYTTKNCPRFVDSSKGEQDG